jgi:hypothetical protein
VGGGAVLDVGADRSRGVPGCGSDHPPATGDVGDGPGRQGEEEEDDDEGGGREVSLDDDGAEEERGESREG